MAAEPSPGRKLLHSYSVGQVHRWHTRGHVIRQYDIAQHCHGVAMTIIILHPDPSALLLKAASTHDWGEFVAGDMPYWLKHKSPETAEVLNEMEKNNRIQFQVDYTSKLTLDELNWLNAADFFDNFMFALQNVVCQNYFMQGTLNKCVRTLRERYAAGTVPIEVIVCMDQILSVYPWVKTW